MKKLIFALLILTSCNVPIRIVETYTTDSTGKPVKTIQKYYEKTETVFPNASLNISTSPFLYPYGYFYGPRVVIPRYYTPRPVYPPRPIYTPRPPIKRH